MEEKIDRLKGKIKETAGVATGNKDLEVEGKADRLGATAKEKLETTKDKLEDAVDNAKEALSRDK